MRILQIIKGFPPALGGSSNQVYLLSRELARLGNDVTVVTTTSMNNKDIRGFSTGRPFTLRSTFPELPKYEVFDGLEVFRFKPVFQFWGYTLNPSMFNFLITNIKDYDIVHAHIYMSIEGDMAAIITRFNDISFILTAYDLLSVRRARSLNMLKRVYDVTLGKHTLSSCNVAIALAEENVKEYMSLGVPKEKITVVPCGIEYEKYGNSVQSEKVARDLGYPEKIVLFVGRLLEYKGAQYIIKAIPKILSFNPSTKFVFVGEDWGYASKLKQLAVDLGIYNSCVFVDLIPFCRNQILRDLYTIADVCVLPSRGEGFGLVALESIASGTPVVLANSKGLSHILTHIGGFALDMSKEIPNQIAEHIHTVFSDPTIHKKVLLQQKVLKRNYSSQMMAKKTLEVYNQLVS